MVYDTMWLDFLRSKVIQKSMHPDRVHPHLLHLSSVITDLVNGSGRVLREGIHRIRFLNYILELMQRLEKSEVGVSHITLHENSKYQHPEV